MSREGLILAFDLDGTLVDTRAAVLAAYREAGVDPERTRWWGRPWREWLPGLCGGEELAAGRLHTLKNALYHKYMHLTRALPQLQLLLRHNGYVLTGASKEAALAVLGHHGVSFEVRGLNCELSTEDKAVVLAGLYYKHRLPGIYFDDDPDVIARTSRLPEWSSCLVHQVAQ